MPSVVHVSDAPTPYREPVHHLVSEQRGGDYHVIYCQQREIPSAMGCYAGRLQQKLPTRKVCRLGRLGSGALGQLQFGCLAGAR